MSVVDDAGSLALDGRSKLPVKKIVLFANSFYYNNESSVISINKSNT